MVFSSPHILDEVASCGLGRFPGFPSGLILLGTRPQTAEKGGHTPVLLLHDNPAAKLEDFPLSRVLKAGPLCLQKEVKPMMKTNSELANKA